MKKLLMAAVLFGIGLVIVQIPRLWEWIAWLIPLVFLPIVFIGGVIKVCKTKS